ncbi:response regulator [Deinococcus hohokamensis]|uniref:Response regulator n=1 Tax=Deinococcus hohokamensis TaxID=309883 RepID=A0ABV9IAP9_9DEIO
MKRVLLIEDHLPDAILLEEWLHEAGVTWTVHPAGTYAAAEAAWHRQPFDLVLLDLDIPDGFGLPLVRRVLTLVGPTPVVILSGYRDEARAAQALALGAHSFQVKSPEAVWALATMFSGAAP